MRKADQVQELGDKRVLIVDRDRKHADWLAEVSRRVVPAVEVASPDIDPETGIDPKSTDLVIIGLDGFESSVRSKLLRVARRWTSQTGKARPLIASEVKHGYPELFRELRAYGLTNMIAINEGVDGSLDLEVTLRKVLSNDVFGLGKYFIGDTTRVDRKVSSSSEVAGVFEEAKTFAEAERIHPRVAQGFATAAEELLMNALYAAPVDADGKPRYAATPRTEVVEMDPGKEVRVAFESAEGRIGLSITDAYGELSVDRCLERLGKCFRMGEGQTEEKPAGAGLGLYVALGGLSHLVVNVRAGARTEVIGLIDVPKNFRDFAGKAKSFNTFVEAQEP